MRWKHHFSVEYLYLTTLIMNSETVDEMRFTSFQISYGYADDKYNCSFPLPPQFVC